MQGVLSFFKFLGLALVGAVVALWRGFVFFMLAIWHHGLVYIEGVNKFTSVPGPESKRRAILQFTFVRYLFRFFLYCFVPFVFLVVPLGTVIVVVATVVTVDQLTRVVFPVDQRFVEIAKEVDGKRPELRDVGATLMSVSYLQMERELDSTLGWTPNDIGGLQFFDNRLNRQLGVRHASLELLEGLSIAISKLGSADEESSLLVKARQSGFAFQPDSWIFPASEAQFRDGIELVKQYQKDLQDNLSHATINITNQDIETILTVIRTRVLEVPHGRLTSRNFEVDWFVLDDRVFFAQGAAIVARDALVAIKYAFAEKIIAAGAMENMDRAISSIEGAVNFYPWWVMRGDADSMFADHRAKMARYFTDTINRISDVAEAIKR